MSSAAAGRRSGEPFEPAGVTWTPVSPRLATARRLSGVVPLAVLAVGVGVVAVASGVMAVWGGVGFLVAAAVWLWWLAGRQASAWAYAEREDDLLVRNGIMFRRVVVVPYGRMQFVDVHAGPVDRIFGIARVQLHTASAGTDAVVPGLVPAEAARLRDRLSSRGQARLAGL